MPTLPGNHNNNPLPEVVMLDSGLASRAAFNRRRQTPAQLVENRTIYERHGAELSIYDTFAPAEKVRLDAEEVLYCGMITGKKCCTAGISSGPISCRMSPL